MLDLFLCMTSSGFQNTAFRLPKFPRTHISTALLCVVAKTHSEQILATIHIRLYDEGPTLQIRLTQKWLELSIQAKQWD